MLRRTLYTLLLVLVAAAAFAQDLSLRYEYWTDSDFDNRVSGSSNEQEVTFATSLRGLAPGLHSLNFRAREDDGVWGSVFRYLFMVTPDKTLDNIGYESWIDGDYNHRTTGIASDSIITELIEVNTLSPGLHCYNVRIQGADGIWSSVFRYLFMVTTNEHAGIARYESWMDGDYDHRTIVEQTEDSLTQTIDISGLADGVHCYNFQAQNADGIWGSVHRFLVFLSSPDASEMPASISYWLDESTDTLTRQAFGTQVTVKMDISELEHGTHTFSCFLQNAMGDTTDVYHFDFNVGYVEKTVIRRQNYSNTVEMSTSTKDATIYYTLDGSKPTAESLRYTEPFEVTRNGIIKAVGTREGWFNSDVTTFHVNWIAEPEDKQPWESGLALIELQGTAISYTLNQQEQESPEQAQWQDRQRILCDTLRAMLRCCTLDKYIKTQNYLTEVEQIEEQLPGIFTLREENETERLRLKAVLDSLTLREDTLRQRLAQVTTKAEVTLIGDSINELQGNYAIINSQKGQLETRIEDWRTQMTAVTTQMKAIENGIVESTVAIKADYALRAEQLQRLHRYPKLQHLDISECTFENDALPDGCLSGLQRLITISLPESVVSFGSRLLANCPQLAAIIWNGTGIVADRVLEGIDNPNLLLYVGQANQVRDVSIRNVVIGGVAKRITLTDGDSPMQNVSFFVPRAFRVTGEISYEHDYRQATLVGECRGWETIALPFDVQQITHETKGECVPFLGYVPDKKPFWLCRLTEEGFKDADCIRANTPYIISMPNSEEYQPAYRIGGIIRFSSSNIAVPKTAPIVSSRAGASFIPAFGCVAASPQVFTLNVGEIQPGYAEGSVFVCNYRDVCPFQAYRTTTDTSVKYISIDNDLPNGGVTSISGLLRQGYTGPMYNLQGIPVQHPTKGVYIQDGKKFIKH